MLEKVVERPYVNLYIGIPENGHEDYMYLDLVIDGEEVVLADSEESVDGLSESQFLETFEYLLSKARNISRILGLSVRIDVESFLESIEDNELSESASKKIKGMIQEFREMVH